MRLQIKYVRHFLRAVSRIVVMSATIPVITSAIAITSSKVFDNRQVQLCSSSPIGNYSIQGYFLSFSAKASLLNKSPMRKPRRATLSS